MTLFDSFLFATLLLKEYAEDSFKSTEEKRIDKKKRSVIAKK